MFFKKKDRNKEKSIPLCSICYHGLKQESGFYCASNNSIISIIPENCDSFSHFMQPPLRKPKVTPLCEICVYLEKDETDKPNYCLSKKEVIIDMPINYCKNWVSTSTKPPTVTSRISCPICKTHKIRRTTGSRFICENGHIFS